MDGGLLQPGESVFGPEIDAEIVKIGELYSWGEERRAQGDVNCRAGKVVASNDRVYVVGRNHEMLRLKHITPEFMSQIGLQ